MQQNQVLVTKPDPLHKAHYWKAQSNSWQSLILAETSLLPWKFVPGQFLLCHLTAKTNPDVAAESEQEIWQELSWHMWQGWGLIQRIPTEGSFPFALSHSFYHINLFTAPCFIKQFLPPSHGHLVDTLSYSSTLKTAAVAACKLQRARGQCMVIILEDNKVTIDFQAILVKHYSSL